MFYHVPTWRHWRGWRVGRFKAHHLHRFIAAFKLFLLSCVCSLFSTHWESAERSVLTVSPSALLFSFLSSSFLRASPAAARGPGWPADGGRDGLGSIRLQVQPGPQLLSAGATGQSYTQHLLEVCQVKASTFSFFGESVCVFCYTTPLALWSHPVLTPLQRNSRTPYLILNKESDNHLRPLQGSFQ